MFSLILNYGVPALVALAGLAVCITGDLSWCGSGKHLPRPGVARLLGLVLIAIAPLAWMLGPELYPAAKRSSADVELAARTRELKDKIVGVQSKYRERMGALAPGPTTTRATTAPSQDELREKLRASQAQLAEMKRLQTEKESELTSLQQQYERLAAQSAAGTPLADSSSPQRRSRAAVVAVAGLLLVRGIGALLGRVPTLSKRTGEGSL